MKKVIRIGTRQSELALWQAHTIQHKLEKLGYQTEIVPVHSSGDLNQKTPLYEMGIIGVFTRNLDIALLEDQIDIAVHSMKDVPTTLPQGIVQTAVIERGFTDDIIVLKKDTDFSKNCTIATSSLRRKAQWLHKYPHHNIVPLRGNVNTRLKKLASENWDGAVFAKAGLERIGILPENHLVLDWMLPAPAQGAVMVVSRENNPFAIAATQKLNNEDTYQTTFAERDFLRTLEGGCSAPIAASATIKEDKIHFKGNLFSIDGKTALEVDKSFARTDFKSIGREAAQEILNEGGRDLMKEIKKVTDRKSKS